MCPHCRAFITARDKVCPYCDTEVGPRAIDRRDPSALLGGFIPHARFVTTLILLINTGLYAATALYSMNAGNEGALFAVDGRTLLLFGAKQRLLLDTYGQWWRLVTAGFLHGGLMHILMNSWVLFDLGAQVEEVYGAARMTVFYFVSTIAGFAASMLWSPSISVGASAGVFGLIGAMIALGMTHRSALGDAIRGMYIRWAIYGLLFGLLPGMRIDNAAHIGGLVAGFGVAWVAGIPSWGLAWRERFWRWAAIACAGLTVACFLKMYFFFAEASKLLPAFR